MDLVEDGGQDDRGRRDIRCPVREYMHTGGIKLVHNLQRNRQVDYLVESPNTREASRMLIPSTITALRTRRYTSTLYIHHTIHGFGYNPMNDGGRYSIQSSFVSNLPPAWSTLAPPITPCGCYAEGHAAGMAAATPKRGPPAR